MNHTVLKTKLTELQETCRRDGVGFPLYELNVADLTIGIVSASSVEKVLFNEPFLCSADVPSFQIKWNCFASHLSSMRFAM